MRVTDFAWLEMIKGALWRAFSLERLVG